MKSVRRLLCGSVRVSEAVSMSLVAHGNPLKSSGNFFVGCGFINVSPKPFPTCRLCVGVCNYHDPFLS